MINTQNEILFFTINIYEESTPPDDEETKDLKINLIGKRKISGTVLRRKTVRK